MSRSKISLFITFIFFYHYCIAQKVDNHFFKNKTYYSNKSYNDDINCGDTVVFSNYNLGICPRSEWKSGKTFPSSYPQYLRKKGKNVIEIITYKKGGGSTVCIIEGFTFKVMTIHNYKYLIIGTCFLRYIKTTKEGYQYFIYFVRD